MVAGKAAARFRGHNMTPDRTKPTGLTSPTAEPRIGYVEFVDPSAAGWHEEDIEPDLDEIVTEDDTPADNFFQAKQQRLLVEPLRTSWKGPDGNGVFLVDANVGIFARSKGKPIVPDVFLSLEVVVGDDYARK